MKRKLGLIGVLYAAILAAIAGYFFRTAQLSGGSSVPVVAFSVLMVLVFALAAVSLEKHAAYAEVYSPCRQDLAFSLLGAAAVLRQKGQKPSAAFYVFAVLFYVAKLFRDFRHWEINPAIGDYCFSLFAMISFMLASYHAGAFSFDRGARRRLAFFSLTGVLFGAISLAGAGLSELLIYAGSLFWMLACAQQMMKKP